VPNAAAVESAQLEPMVRNSPVGAASALVGGGMMVGAVAYENGSLIPKLSKRDSDGEIPESACV
jgi:hypothetical protein